MALKGKKPEVKEKRLKMMIYGPAGVGKTVAAIQFPQAYIIDTERGTDFYSKTIEKSKSAVFKSQDPDEIYDEIKSLLTEKHSYKTLIIDPITIVYMACQDKWARIFEKHCTNPKDREVGDFGFRFWGKVKAQFKSIQRLVLALDMNVIITAHQKDIFGNSFNRIGVGPDSMRGDEFIFDYIFRIEQRADGGRKAITMKERAEIGEHKFPDDFDWSYPNFLKFYGKDIIEKDVVPLAMATGEQVLRVEQLVEAIRVEDEVVNKWFNKENVSMWNEFTEASIIKCIKYLEKQLKGIEKEVKK